MNTEMCLFINFTFGLRVFFFFKFNCLEILKRLKAACRGKLCSPLNHPSFLKARPSRPLQRLLRDLLVAAEGLGGRAEVGGGRGRQGGQGRPVRGRGAEERQGGGGGGEVVRRVLLPVHGEDISFTFF